MNLSLLRQNQSEIKQVARLQYQVIVEVKEIDLGYSDSNASCSARVICELKCNLIDNLKCI